MTRTPMALKRSFESFRLDRGNDAVDVLVHAGVIDIVAARDDAKEFGARNRVRMLGGGNQGLEGTQPVLRQSPPILPFR